MNRTEILEILTLNDGLKEGFGLLDSVLSLSLSVDAITEFAVEHKIASSMAARVFVIESLLTGISTTAIDPRWQQNLVTSITHYTSTNGNPTWKCTLAGQGTVYIRQENKQKWLDAGYTLLADMRLNDTWDANITVYTTVGDKGFIDCQHIVSGGTIAMPVKPAATDDGELLHIDFSIAQEARAWLDAGCYVLDTETTGLAADDRVVSLAILDSKGTVLLNTLINPERVIPAKATQIHGITNDMVKDAPLIHEIKIGAQTLQEWLLEHEDKIVVYNAEFDAKMLNQSLFDRETAKAAGFKFPFCAMTLYAKHNGDWDDRKGDYRWVSLAKACDIEELPEPNHSALGDATATLSLVQHLARGMRLPF